ncbi:MAG TPA: nucleotide disphospho-sugar-binding domain-containing protein, partial [Pirellulales bacterium]|nr:nucleotide disphospho-sugar-binding domain-containing protein [Pirellulales bacterium]
TGFPLYDEGDLIEPDADLLAFVESDSPPIAFTPGSANVHGRAFFETAIEACRLLGRRALLLTRFPEQLPPLPEHARHFEFVPFGWLLPRTAAVVHHGGVGSTSQGFAGGVPQLLMPLGFDQFDNAKRVVRLGAGDYLTPAKFTATSVARVLQRLIESPDVAASCHALAERSRQQNALATMCEAIERLGARRLTPGDSPGANGP